MRMNSVHLLKKIFTLALFLTGVILLLLWANMEIISFNDAMASPKAIPINVKNRVCSVNLEDVRGHVDNKSDLKMIYFVTPTYPRPTQIPELTRLSHTLMHVPRVHWIVADDQAICSEQVQNILRRTRLPFTHISSPKPYVYNTNIFPRGVANRRAALTWIRENARNGILYFGDDDNTFDLQLFEEIRRTKRVAMLPVGLIGGYGVSSPVVSNGKVVAFYDSWPYDRTFPVDMAGFAVNIEYLTPSASMPYIPGIEEDRFLVSLGLKMEDIEPLADNCSKVYVWHTKTVKIKKPDLKADLYKLEAMPEYAGFSNLLKETVKLGMANIFPENGTRIRIIKDKKTYDVVNGLQ